MANQNNEIKVSGISLSLSGVNILDNVCAIFKAGKISAIIGPNGAGKSSLLNVITGVLKPSSGSVELRWAGTDYNLMELAPWQISRLCIARQFQDNKNFSNMSIWENVAVAAMFSNFSDSSRKTIVAWNNAESLISYVTSRLLPHSIHHRTKSVLNIVGIFNLRNKIAREVSVGTRKLLSLARILVQNPNFILLDEPVAGLSGYAFKKVMQAIKSYIDSQDAGVIMIEHNPKIITNHTDYIYYMEQGKIQIHGKTDKVLKNKDMWKKYIGL
ncbi:MAG: hypothetical protein BBJ57_06365 [Desulfobacterales bacterium PC51MH44]|nr:MAG: hypothetical protein BBJ57_06365 [Desulfobacterales bacterium PC51MH44]